MAYAQARPIDGGHFENLALYEMIRRRRRFIVVSDAGCDPKFQLEYLGNAVRKVPIDLGVRITFEKLEQLRRRREKNDTAGTPAPDHAVGTRVRSCAMAHPEFPHESTDDRWFSESQFERYRALGFEVTNSVLADAVARLPADARPSLRSIFEVLR